MKPLSLRTRLTVWYTLGLGATLLAFGLLLQESLTATLSHEFDERLLSAADVGEFAVRDGIRDQGVDATALHLLPQLRLIDIDLAVAVGMSDSSGDTRLFRGSDSVLATIAALVPCRVQPITRQRLGATSYRFLSRCVSPTETVRDVAIVVGAPEGELTAQTRRIQGIIAVALLIGLALTTLGGHWLSGKAIAPIRRMGARVRQIGSENLNQRLPVAPAEGEIAELSVMVNALFDRLAATMGRERQFLANAAHALRTPVAVLQGELAEAARRQDVTEIEALVGHLGRTVDYLLALARRDAGAEPAAGERLYLDDVVSGSVARLGKVAERRGIHLAWGELSETPVYTNAHLLDQVTQILLENALQYTSEGGTVTISVTAEDDTGRLVVEDTGPGLAPEDQTSLFTPFVRGSAARRSGSTGSGLGLAVAKWMVESCGGTIATEAVEPHGARFVVHFPAGR